ncbi:primosomal protein N' [Rhodovibrionaceae bacterium A322]
MSETSGKTAPQAAGDFSSLLEFSGDDVRVSVLLPLPLASAYTYLAPADLSLTPGDLVRVPFGQRDLCGVVWDEAPDQKLAYNKLKSVLERFDLPPLPEAERRFVDWVASYTLAAPGAVLRMALSVPAALEAPRPQKAVRLAEGALPGDLRLTPARKRVLAAAESGFAFSARDLAHEAGVGESVVKGLVKLGALVVVTLPPRPDFEEPDWRRKGVELTAGQLEAATALRQAQGAGFSVTLLDGVTGSGKTEVYLEAVAAALEQDKQVLVLLPEISLSAQWLGRFEKRFGVKPALWHSEVTAPQRRRTWRAISQGQAKVVVGARSALFLPYKDLGLIVVDEEHESAFKQEEGVIYHARDMAVVRARLGDFPIILASATPSLESQLNVTAGKYQALHLPTRHGGAELPSIELVDLRKEAPPREAGKPQEWLSPPLRQALRETLARGEQGLLYLNRRGYAPLTLCRTCGHRLQCPHCTAWLVEHRFRKRLQCHHCGYQLPLPDTCPQCEDSHSLVACGPGVERLAEEIDALFPEARTALLSSDTLLGPTAAAELIEKIHNHEIDLVVGTQIVAKGHHFPKLTCVGVVDADLGLAGGDLRALERSYQLLHQVAGRAGRAEAPGRVLLQTYDPDHPVMRALASGDRDAFYDMEAEARERGLLPPYSKLAALVLSDPDGTRVDEAARQISRSAPQVRGLQILGPTEAPLAVLRGRHRRRFLLRADQDLPLQRILRDWLSPLRLPNSTRLNVDINPYSFM